MISSLRVGSLALLAVAALNACSGDSAGPDDSPPNVAGLYQEHLVLSATTCTPQRPPSGGTVILDAFEDTYSSRIRQSGTQITLEFADAPDDDPLTGTIDREGNLDLSLSLAFQEDPRAGNRIFFVDLTITVELRRVENGARLVGTGTYVNVFREGSPTAPVFATCSRTSTIELTRTGS